MAGTLFLVATPIGNLQDMTPRAVETLKKVAIIACEDTRHTRKLLTHFDISTKSVSYHEHNESERAEQLLQELAAGRSVAVVSDAGTPGISDPGHQIIRRAIEAGIAVVPIPGPAAFVNAVVASGLATDSMFFGGFLPSKKGDRRRRLAEVTNIPATLVFYESPHRLERSLSDCLEILGDRRAALAREITKIHEEFIRGRLSELIDKISHANLKGEFVLVIDRAAEAVIDSSDRPSLAERVAQLEAEGHERKAALKLAAKEFGMSKSEAYRLVQAEKK